MRTSQTRIVAALITVLACLLMAGAALAQGEQKINVQYAGTELGKVLETFKRFDPAFAYTLPPGYESKAITAGLVDVTIEEALTIVLDQVGLRFFKDNNLYSIREKTERGAGVLIGRSPPPMVPRSLPRVRRNPLRRRAGLLHRPQPVRRRKAKTSAPTCRSA